jgi:chemotaxis protein CheX
MPVDVSTMNQILCNVFEQMLGLTTEAEQPSLPDSLQKRLLASIRITGTEEELMVLETPLPTAQLIAETMFAAEPGTLSDEEVRDAVGEIVNMIGGNVKGTYTHESVLSLPCVWSEPGEVPVDASEFCEAYAIHFAVEGCPVLIRWTEGVAVSA